MSEQTWRQIARALYVSILGHRADMHGASKRPCATCHQSAEAIRMYDEASNAERPSPGGTGTGRE